VGGPIEAIDVVFVYLFYGEAPPAPPRQFPPMLQLSTLRDPGVEEAFGFPTFFEVHGDDARFRDHMRSPGDIDDFSISQERTIPPCRDRRPAEARALSRGVTGMFSRSESGWSPDLRKPTP